MKYLNLKESETRDITEPGVINEELSTKTTPITIDRFYEFDETLNQSNVYDIELTGENALLSYDNPERIGNFKEANFEWEFTVPNDVKKVMRFWVKVPVEFQENEDNLVPNDDWAFIEAAVLESDMVMRELELIDPETGEVVESFKREIDNLEPFNTNKEKLIRTNSDPRNASGLKKGKKYKVRAKYQYISFEEGKFDISKPELMTDKQRSLSTGVIPNELDVHYSYDDNVFKDGVFDESFKKISTDKPNIELKNLEYATFEWEGKTGLGNKE